jgi:hypothetical protein
MPGSWRQHSALAVLEAVLREVVANILGYSGGMGRHLLVPDLHQGVLGLDPQHAVVWAVIPGLVVVASFSVEVGRPMMVIQATTGSSDVASDENRASTSVMVDDDDVFGCCFLHEALSTLLSLFDSAAPGETLDPGLPDRMMAAPSVVTPLEGIILEHMSTGGGATLGETPDRGLLDRTMATRGVVLPTGASFLEQSLDSGGSQGERRVPSRINDGGFWQRGAVEARGRVRVVLRA